MEKTKYEAGVQLGDVTAQFVEERNLHVTHQLQNAGAAVKLDLSTLMALVENHPVHYILDNFHFKNRNKFSCKPNDCFHSEKIDRKDLEKFDELIFKFDENKIPHLFEKKTKKTCQELLSFFGPLVTLKFKIPSRYPKDILWNWI